jgi:hypothetical protein
VALLLLPGLGTFEDLDRGHDLGGSVPRIAPHCTEANVSATSLQVLASGCTTGRGRYRCAVPSLDARAAGGMGPHVYGVSVGAAGYRADSAAARELQTSGPGGGVHIVSRSRPFDKSGEPLSGPPWHS